MARDPTRDWVEDTLLWFRRQPGTYDERLAHADPLINVVGGGSAREAKRKLLEILREHAGRPDGDVIAYFYTSGYRTDGANLDERLKRYAKRHHVVPRTGASDRLEHLRTAAGLDAIQEPSTREALGGALVWCCDLLQQGLTPSEIKKRIRVGDESTLLNVPGVHLLTGHVGKGQQFDWVLIVGAEDGSIPDFRAKTQPALQEEARILSVMLSRARHGAVMMCARRVPAASTGVVYAKQPSRFWSTVEPACVDLSASVAWLKAAPWPDITER